MVVYDQSSKEAAHLSKDGFVHILMGKLEATFHKVSLLTGTWERDEHECHQRPVFVCLYFYVHEKKYFLHLEWTGLI